MNIELFKTLLQKGEGEIIDYKEISYFSKGNKSDPKDSDFIKDILSFSNTMRSESAYILIGVKEVNRKGEVVGMERNDSIDEASIQQKLKDKVTPIPKIVLHSLEYENKWVEIIEIPIYPISSPSVPTFSVGNKLRKDQIYLRRGSSNSEATFDEIIRLNNWLKMIPEILAKSIDEDFSNARYFDVALHENFIANNITIGGVSANAKVKFFIRSIFYRTSSTGKNEFYKNLLFDSNYKRIKNNSIVWEGITCRIQEEEIWGSIDNKSNSNYLIIRAFITDKTSIEEEYRFIVGDHDGKVFQKILDILKMLVLVGSHNAHRICRNQEIEIEKLKKRISILEDERKSK